MTAPALKTLIVHPGRLRHLPLLVRALGEIDWRIREVAAPDAPLAREWAESVKIPLTGDLGGIEAVLALWDGDEDGIGLTVATARETGLRVHVYRLGLRDDAECLLCGLRADGFTLRLKDGKALLSPLSKLTPERRAALRQHHAQIVELLQEEEAYERRALALVSFEPDWSQGPVQQVDAMILRWLDEAGEVIHEIVTTPEEHEMLLRWSQRNERGKEVVGEAAPKSRKRRRAKP